MRFVAKKAVFCELCGAKKKNGDTKNFTPNIMDKWLFDFVESGHVARSVASSDLVKSFDQFVVKTGADFNKCSDMSLGRYLSKLGIKRSRASINKPLGISNNFQQAIQLLISRILMIFQKFFELSIKFCNLCVTCFEFS